MNIEELENLARAATPGPWQFDNHSPALPILGLYASDNKSIWHGSRSIDQTTLNTEFIAAANPAAILEFISEYKNAIRLLSIANNGLSGSHTIAWQAQTKVAIARANGESNG